MPERASSGTLTRIAVGELLRAMAVNIGQQLSGMVVGSKSNLLSEAINSGATDPDLISKTAQIFASLAAPITKLDFSKVLPNDGKASHTKLERALIENINETSGAFYLFIDDTGQVALPGTVGHVNRIWSVLLAARVICQKIPAVRVLVSLRDEIWRDLGREEVSQRDQLDHFAPLVYQLNPDLDHVQKIFERRITLAANMLGYEGSSVPYEYFFEGKNPRMPTSKKKSSWPDIIRTRSRGRPRDAIQLIRILARAARSNSPAVRISDEILESVMPEFSGTRVRLLTQEYEKECPALEDIINTFRSFYFDEGSFTASAEEVYKHLEKVPSQFSVYLNGKALRSSERESVFRLWAFLFSIGFITPRVSDQRNPNGYALISASEQPLFVHSRRWNSMQQALWEVHPSYRDHIITLQAEYQAKFGLPRKPKMF